MFPYLFINLKTVLNFEYILFYFFYYSFYVINSFRIHYKAIFGIRITWIVLMIASKCNWYIFYIYNSYEYSHSMYFPLRRVCKKKNIIFVKFVNGILRKDSFFIGLHDFNLIHNIIAMLEYNELIAAKREWLNNQKMVLLLNVCTLYIIQKTCSLLNAK